MDKLNSTPPYAVDAQNEYQTQLSQRSLLYAEWEFEKPSAWLCSSAHFA